jgi:hypothetical protein
MINKQVKRIGVFNEVDLEMEFDHARRVQFLRRPLAVRQCSPMRLVHDSPMEGNF